VDHTDATGDKLIARIVAEGRGGRVIADTFGGGLAYIAQMAEQKLLAPLVIPETAAYPSHLKNEFWLATDTQFFIIGWNTNLVKKGDEPKGFEDLGNAKWKGALMGESRDFQLLLGLAKAKYKSDDKAIDVIKRIALNQVEFHRGHSQLIEFLVAGQRPVCFTCYAHQFPPRMKKAAPIQPVIAEGVGEIGGSVGIIRGAPHPNTALLWARWVASEEGQRVYAQAGETPRSSQCRPGGESPADSGLHARPRRRQRISQVRKGLEGDISDTLRQANRKEIAAGMPIIIFNQLDECVTCA